MSRRGRSRGCQKQYNRIILAWRTSFYFLILPLLATALGAQTVQRGMRGGTLVIAQRSEPKTLNPLLSRDAPSREVLGRLSSDLMSVNRQTQKVEPVLAEWVHPSADGLHYTVHLRSGLRFSDGQPFNADDVVFSFQVYLDEKVHAVQRDPLLIHEKPVTVSKLDGQTVRIDLPGRYAPGERMFDSLPMLPRHLLEAAYREGKLNQVWGLSTKPEAMAGLGPFRVKEYRAGERLVLERNPYYWKAPQPYLDEIVFLFVGDEDAQIARFLTGDVDLVNRVSARNVGLLRARGVRVEDLGPSLEYNFLLFNLTKDASPGPKEWFQIKAFRQAVSAAIDRDGIVKLVYGGLASPLASPVSPGNKAWLNQKLTAGKHSAEQAKKLLSESGFTRDKAGELRDRNGKTVEFTIATGASSQERSAMATMIQADLQAIGMKVQIVPLESRSMVDRILNTHQYDTAVMGLGGADPDPVFETNVWKSAGGMHVWNPEQKQPATSWEAEIDRLMDEQASELKQEKRRELYNRVQEIVAEEMPLICLTSPHVLVAAQPRVKNLRPTIFDHYTLWNSDELFVAEAKTKERSAGR